MMAGDSAQHHGDKFCRRALTFDSIPTLNRQTASYERKPRMRLPSFAELGIAARTSSERDAKSHSTFLDPQFSPTEEHCELKMSLRLRGRPASSSWPLRHAGNIPSRGSISGIALPLTPPEDVDCFHWSTFEQIETAQRAYITASGSGENHDSKQSLARQSIQSSGGRPTEIALPPCVNIDVVERSPSNWVDRATEILISNLTQSIHDSQVQMVVQALPSQSKNPNAKPVFQELVEQIQLQSRHVPYITITHAVSQVMTMEEVPASPPATPNMMHTSDEYFQDQSIFTHAAVVPGYHSKAISSMPSGPGPSSIIVAPSSTQISILERYIPPTTTKEVQDFFSISRRSYLVDRLTELSGSCGTLLLVYPTKQGGTTFSKRYIGPVIDPFLRQFVMLNDLTSDAATAMGRMEAVPNMIAFEEMRNKLGGLCEELTQRAPSRGQRTSYSVIHAETSEVTLDRSTWMGWFIEQEQGRLRQDLVDYQKAGGRMPSRGFEASPGLLAREVIEGLQNCRTVAGGTGIEVGIFVIKRSTL